MLSVALLAAATGGWRAEIAGVTLSVRAVWRPLAIVAMLLIARWLTARDRATRAADFSAAAARIVAGACLLSGVMAWMTCLSPYVGGADSYGYVSAAERIRDGTLIHREPLAAILPYADGIGPATPLGYVRSPRIAESNVPAYPLGLPALMAVAAGLFGPRAPFLVPLALGLVLIATCVWLTRAWSGDVTMALAAGAAVAWHPVVFTYAIQPMSDVPAAALYIAAAALLIRDRPAFAVAAGFAAAAAFLIRTALLPGIAALALLPLTGGTSRRWRVIAFLGIVAASVGLQGWLQWYLYGSPSGNGYGPATELFSLRFLAGNVRSYSYWGALMNGPLWMAGVVAGVGALRSNSARVLLLATLISVALPYAVYRPYDHWQTQRFILPFLAVATVDRRGRARIVVATSRGTSSRHMDRPWADGCDDRFLDPLARSRADVHARSRGRTLRPSRRTRGARDTGQRGYSRVATLRQPALLHRSSDTELGKDSGGAIRRDGRRAGASRVPGVSDVRRRGRAERTHLAARRRRQPRSLAAEWSASRHPVVRVGDARKPQR